MDNVMLGVGVTAGINAVYAISRTWTKASGENKGAGFKTTEFWTTVFTSILGVLAAIGVVK